MECCLNFRSPIEDAISRIRFAPTSNNLLISSWDSNLRLYDVDGCVLRLEAPAGGAALLDCCFGSESMAFSANSDGSVFRYDLHSGISQALGNHDDLVTCVEYSEETCQVVTGGLDKKLNFWDARTACSLKCLSNLTAEVRSMSVSGLSLMVAVESSVNIYDLRFLDASVQGKEPFGEIHVNCVCSSSELEGFAVGSIDGRVALEYLGKSSSEIKGYAFKCFPKEKNGRSHLVAVNDIAFNPSASGVLATGDDEGNVIMWNLLIKKQIAQLPRYPNNVASLAYNNGGQLLAVGSSYTYQEAKEREEPPQIFVHHADDICMKPLSASSSKIKTTQVR